MTGSAPFAVNCQPENDGISSAVHNGSGRAKALARPSSPRWKIKGRLPLSKPSKRPPSLLHRSQWVAGASRRKSRLPSRSSPPMKILSSPAWISPSMEAWPRSDPDAVPRLALQPRQSRDRHCTEPRAPSLLVSDKTISAHGMYDSTQQHAQPQVRALLREFDWMIERCPALGGRSVTIQSLTMSELCRSI